MALNGPNDLPNPSLDVLDQKINDLQRSTKTLLPFFVPFHNWLRMRSRWYYNWHLKKNAAKIHKTVAIAYAIGMVLTFVNFTLYYSVQPVQAAALTWDGGGSTNDWSECANWTTDTCPTSADAVTLNSTSTKDATVDASFGGVVSSITLASGYTGTVTLARSFQTASTSSPSLRVDAGTFNAGSQTVDVDGSLVLTGGTMTLSSGTTTVGKDINFTGGTFNHNSGTLTIDSATTASLACNSATFNLVTFNASTSTKTVGSSCSLPLGASPTVTGVISVGGTLSGTGTITFSTTNTHTATGVLSGFTGIISNGTFTLNGPTYDWGNYTTVDINGGFTLTSGTFTAPSGTMTVSGGITYTAGTFTHNSGTVTLDGGSATINCGAMSFNLVTMTAGKTLSSGCTLPLGANPTIATLTTSGTLSGSGTITTTGFISNAGASLSGFSGIAVTGAFTVQGATYDLSSYTTFTVTGTTTVSSGTLTLGSGMSIAAFAQSGGTFNAPSGTLTINSTFNVSAGTFNANSGTINFGTSTATLTCTGVTFNSVVFATATSTKTVSSSCTMPLGASPTIGGPISLSGTLSGSGTATFSSTLSLGSTGALSGFSGLVVGSTFTMNGGTIDLGSYTTVDFNGTFTFTSGTFTAPTGTMTVAGGYTYTAGTFNANSGTVTFDGVSGTINCGAVAFNLVTFNHSSTKTVSSGCTLPLGSNPTIPTSITVNGTLSGTGTLTLTTNTITFSTGSSVSGFTGFSKGSSGTGSITVSGGTIDFGSFTSTVINGLTISSGTFTAPSGTMQVGTTFNNSGGTFNANGGTVEFTAGGTTTCSGTTFNLVAISHSASTRTFSSCTVPLGANPPTIYQTILTNSSLSGTGTLTTHGAIWFNSGSSLSGFTRFVGNNQIVVQGGTVDFSGYDVVDINNNVTITSGTLTAPSGTMSMSSNLTYTGGTFNHGNGVVLLDGASGTIACNGMVFNRVDVEATGTKTISNGCSLPFGSNPVIRGAVIINGIITGTGRLISDNGGFTINSTGRVSGFSALTTNGTFQLNGSTADFGSYDDMDINGSLSLAGGTFIAPKYLSVSGTWNKGSGVFVNNGGTVDLDGNEQIVNGVNTFHNLTKAPLNGTTLTIAADTLQTVQGTLKLVGKASDQRLKIISSGSGTQWQIDPQGAREVRNLDLTDGFNINSTKVNLAGTNSLDGGNNVGWAWFTPSVDNLGPSSLTDGSTGASSTPKMTFTIGDGDSGDTIAHTVQIDDSADFASLVVDFTSATGAGGDKSFTVGQEADGGTYTEGKAGQKLKDGSYYWRVKVTDNNGSASDWVYANLTKPAFTVGTVETSTEAPVTATGSSNDKSSSSSASSSSSSSDGTTKKSEKEIKVDLEIKVLDDDQKPVKGASVTLHSEPRHAVTGSDGIAHFDDVPTGEHRVVIAYNGKVGEKKIVVTGTSENDVTVAASPIPVDLTIQLKDTEPVKQTNYYLMISIASMAVIVMLLVLRYLHYRKLHPDQQI